MWVHVVFAKGYLQSCGFSYLQSSEVKWMNADLLAAYGRRYPVQELTQKCMQVCIKKSPVSLDVRLSVGKW
jgi:hypothetical protein